MGTRSQDVLSDAVRYALILPLGLVLASQPVRADDDDPDSLTGIRPASVAHLLPTGGDVGGHRAALAGKGIAYKLNYVSDIFSNTAGGKRRGTIYDGRTEFLVDGDLEKLMGWKGSSFRINGFHIHGAALTRSYVGNIAPVSNIEAYPTVRLFEAWVQQQYGIFSLRIGQIGADSETATSATASLFNNGTFGWPSLAAANLPSGGPAYPLATPGATLKVDLSAVAPASLLFSLANGDPARPGTADPQLRNKHGADFRLRSGTLAIAEARYGINQEKDSTGLPGFLRVGAWYHSARFDDRRWGTDGLSLADPASNGTALRHRGNHGFYAGMDQTLWRRAGGEPGAIGVFSRVFASPSDRNLLSWQIDGGIAFNGLLPSRPNDAFGVAVSHMRMSRDARALDRDAAMFAGSGTVRSAETAIEANYLMEVTRGWTLQPTLQYVIRPGAGSANPLEPANPDRVMRNATVVGVRSVVRY